MRLGVFFILLTLLYGCQSHGEKQNTTVSGQNYNGPIIDMHIHSISGDDFSPDSLAMCLPIMNILPHFDPKDDYIEEWTKKLMNPECVDPIWAPKDYTTFFARLDEQFEKYQIEGAATSGPPDDVERMYAELGDRIIKSAQLRIGRDDMTPDSLKALVQNHGYVILGEISNQYEGIAANDPRMDPFYAMAEELDIPVAIHMGAGLPGHFYFESGLSPRLSNPLDLEPVIRKFPKLRISIMHYGEPYVDELIAMMTNFPQLYADIGGMQIFYPRAYFYEYHLKKIVSAGFGKRIMFGSDMIIWPEILGEAVKVINEAPFLSHDQKADIFYNNASRFLRLH